MLIIVFFNSSPQAFSQCGVTDATETSTFILDKSKNPYADYKWDEKSSNWVVYINVNIHFILNDNGTGRTAIRSGLTGLRENEVFDRARRMIENTNAFAEDMGYNLPNNQNFHQATVTQEQFIHQRFVLSGVFTHYATNLMSLSTNTENFFNSYSAYPNALNVIVADVPIADGYANFIGSRALVVEVYDASLLLHEITHTLGVNHTFSGIDTNHDGCHDTWHFKDRFHQVNPNLSIWLSDRCWDTNPVEDIDGDGSDDDLCDLTNPLVTKIHPCCLEEWQNNNLMAYGLRGTQSNHATLTPCQMGKMNTHLFASKGDLIEANNPTCPPPSAVIGNLATFDPNETNCWFTLYFQGSMHASTYRHEIFEGSSTSGTRIYDSGTINGNPNYYTQTYGQPFDPNKPWYVDHLLKMGTYTVSFSVTNECGITDTETITFNYPSCPSEPGGDTDPGPIVIGPRDPGNITVYPNPYVVGKGKGVTVETNFDPETPVLYYLTGTDVYGRISNKMELSQLDKSSFGKGNRLLIPDVFLVRGMNYLEVVTPEKITVHKIQGN